LLYFVRYVIILKDNLILFQTEFKFNLP